MALFGPTGTSISSSQFRLKYPKTRLNEPSLLGSHPSKAGAMVRPVVRICAFVGTNVAMIATAIAAVAYVARCFIRDTFGALPCSDHGFLFFVPAERAAEDALSEADSKLLSPFRHLAVEFLLGQLNAADDARHHVVH